MAYVIKSWHAADQPNANNHFVAITVREEGVISWFLAIFGFDPTVSINVSDSRIEFSEVSLSGSIRRVIPLLSVCSSVYGYHKPWKKSLGIAIVLILIIAGITSGITGGFSFGGLFCGMLIGAIVALLYFFLNRTLTFGFVDDSGLLSAIEFRRSVVENLDINEDQAGYVCQLVQACIEAREHGSTLNK
jgi:hypothetical protein